MEDLRTRLGWTNVDVSETVVRFHTNAYLIAAQWPLWGWLHLPLCPCRRDPRGPPLSTGRFSHRPRTTPVHCLRARPPRRREDRAPPHAAIDNQATLFLPMCLLSFPRGVRAMSPPQQTTSDAPTLQHTGKLRRALPRMSPLHVRESPRSALQGCSPAPPPRCTLRPGSTTLLFPLRLQLPRWTARRPGLKCPFLRIHDCRLRQ